MSKSETNNETNSEDNEWVLDSLVGFLKSEVWSVSTLAFIEQKSVVFDPEEVSHESQHEYRLLFEEYKNLVDRLLSGHMSDLGISERQFDDACRRAEGLLANRFRQLLFEQIWAANDFDIFVRFMTQRNIELQLQALEVLAQRFGFVYDSFIPHGSDKDSYLNDETVINEAIKRSLAQEEDEREEEEGVSACADTTVENNTEQKIQVMEEKARLESEHERQHQKLSLAIHSALVIDDNNAEKHESNSDKELPLLKTYPKEDKPLSKVDPIVKQHKESENKDEKQVKQDSDESAINADQIRKRTEYLRKQRDKLLEIKKHEREKQLVKIEEQELMAKRPKSAKAMRSVVEHKRDDDLDESDQSLAFRRSLAARLKAEVVEHQNQ